MVPLAQVHQCKHCGASLKTAQGLKSHITQRASCHEAYAEHIRQAHHFHGHLSRHTSASASIPDIPPEQYDAELTEDGSGGEPPSKRIRIEETLDAGGLPKRPFVDDPANTLDKLLRTGNTAFQEYLNRCRANKDANIPYGPFVDDEEWRLGDWLMTCGLSKEEIDKYLKLKIVSTHALDPPLI